MGDLNCESTNHELTNHQSDSVTSALKTSMDTSKTCQETVVSSKSINEINDSAEVSKEENCKVVNRLAFDKLNEDSVGSESRLNPSGTNSLDNDDSQSRSAQDFSEDSFDRDLNSNKNDPLATEDDAPRIFTNTPSSSREHQNNEESAKKNKLCIEIEDDSMDAGSREKEDNSMDVGSKEKEDSSMAVGSKEMEDNNMDIGSKEKEDSSMDVENKEKEGSSMDVGMKEKEDNNMDIGSKEKEDNSMDVGSKEKEDNNMDVGSKEKEDNNMDVGSKEKEDNSMDLGSKEKEDSNMEVESKETENSSMDVESKDKEDSNQKNGNKDKESPMEAESSKSGQNDDSDKGKTSAGDGNLKIHMVTSLENSSDVFVEPPSGPISPAVNMSNPLEIDAEGNKTKDSSEKNALKSDGDMDEVITGDKTVSPEFVKNNLNVSSDGTTISKDHGYSRKANGPNLSGVNEATPKKIIPKVIYPKKKFTDINQLKIMKVSPEKKEQCIQCAKETFCPMTVEIGEKNLCYLCSDDCLKQHKIVHLSTLQRKSAVILPAPDDSDDSRLCVNCDTNVAILPQDKVLSWETMEFCNEECLGKYQVKMWSFCTACQKEVPTSSMGKYCVRFGIEIKQFCCASCLEEFKKGIKVCSFCQKDLTGSEDCFLAPIGDKGQFRDFCSQACLDEYYCMSHNMPGGSVATAQCLVCDKKQLIQIQVITVNQGTVNICSDVCLAAFKFVNKSICSAPCYMCKKNYDKNLRDRSTIYYENDLLAFCSKKCMNINILAKRKIVACCWCKVKKYNFDMIRKKSLNGTVGNWCSVNCMTLYNVSMNAISHRSNKVPCAQCKSLSFPELHLTMSDATIRNFCSLSCANTFQQAFGNTGSQNGGAVPTGVPSKLFRASSHASQTPQSVGSPKSDQVVSLGVTQTTGGPVIQSVGSMKKPEIKILAPAAMNGTVQTSSLMPTNQATLAQPMVQYVKQSILVVPPRPPRVSNAKVQVKPSMVSKSTSATVAKSVKGSQTDEEEKKQPILIPIPVPIFIPCPMAMYTTPVPTPFPFPVPVPVPIIIPTTKGTAEDILADIKRIQEQMPGNPYEAELIMMAEIAEGEKKLREGADASSLDGGVNERRGGLKRPGSSAKDEDDDWPPEKKRKEEVVQSSSNALDTAVHQLATSRIPMSLKETLGVSAWRHYAAQTGERTDLLEMRPEELAQALKGFLKNAKIPGNGQYTPDQKYYLMLGIQYYLEENGRIDNIFFDSLFNPFIDALDEDAKHFQSDNIITRVEEEHLWESKQLGPHSPISLLATLIYFNTKYFNITTVEEHMQLSFNQIKKHWKRNPNSTSPTSNPKPSVMGSRNVLLSYYPPQSVLDANSKKKKVYEQEANDENPYRCPIHLYDFYLSKCPESVKARNDLFYLSPERSCVPDSPIWYSTASLSEAFLRRILNRFKMVKEINLAILSSA